MSKDVRVIGKVRAGQTAETEAHAARDEVRKEDVEVDEGVDTGGPSLRDKREQAHLHVVPASRESHPALTIPQGEDMMDFLQNILGGQQQQDYQDFVQRYDQGHPSEGYSDQEVLNRYQQVAPQLSPQQYQQAAMASLNRLSPQERMQLGQYLMQQAQQQGIRMPGVPQGGMGDYENPHYLAQQMAQMHQQQPDMLHQILGPGGALGNPLAKAALAGVAAMAAKKFFGGGLS